MSRITWCLHTTKNVERHEKNRQVISDWLDLLAYMRYGRFVLIVLKHSSFVTSLFARVNVVICHTILIDYIIDGVVAQWRIYFLWRLIILTVKILLRRKGRRCKSCGWSMRVSKFIVIKWFENSYTNQIGLCNKVSSQISHSFPSL